MASIAILGCGNIGFYIASHLIYNNHHAFYNPYNNNKILCVGRQRLLDELNLSKKLTLTKLESYGPLKEKDENYAHYKSDECEEIVISKDEIIYEINLKELIKFNPDYVIVTLKSNQIFNVFDELKDLNGKTTIISIQNGLHNAEMIKQLLPNTTIVRGFINDITVTHKPGSSCHFIQRSSSSGSITLEFTPDTIRFQKILEQSELPCSISYDIKSMMYSKLLVNLNTSLFAISGLSYSEYLQDNNFREVYKKCVLEGLNVYRLNEITFGNNSLIRNLSKFLDYVPRWVSESALDRFLMGQDVNYSMFYDFKLAKKTEVDFLQGEIVKLSDNIKKDINQKKGAQREGNADVKYNRGILNLIKMIEDRMQESKKGWDEKISDKEVLNYIETGEVPKILHN